MYTQLLILVVITILIFILRNNKEDFNFAFRETAGKTFGRYYQPERCTPGNNCFKGSYLRSQTYQNVCPPKFGGLTREKINLQDDCQRTLGNYPPQKHKFICTIDKHLNRKCGWYYV